jgi:hypothetical protein
VRTEDPGLHAAVDRTGRRLLVGLLSSSLVFSGAGLLARGLEQLGIALFVAGGLLVACLGVTEALYGLRRSRKKR